MNNKKVILVGALAFTLGFYLSEYRHANNNQHPQMSVSVVANDAPSISPIHSSAQAASSEPSASAAEFLPARPQTPIERANQLIANGAYGEAVRLLNKLLEQNPQYTEALWLLARVYEQQGQHKESVASWFRYINTEVDAQKIDNALAYLAKYLIRLTENPSIFGESYEWLMAQINDLIKLTPDNGELHLQLAKMNLKIEDKEQAQYHALMAANQPATRARAEGILAKLDEGSTADDNAVPEISVQLTRFGDQFLVPVTIEGVQVKLLLDTGASISGLTASFVNRHYSFVKSPKPIQLNTASGTVESYLFLVDTFTIESVTFNKHMLARLPMDNSDQFDGLLGIDILGRFDFVIDQNKAVLRLKKR
ncbi:aspartyl protease family protein [Cellvibrio sp. OA-2007]|uniref:aspartyl protease family protein n=1 Tax=Cellvibrio sp. OA-2007 TaxID=529823 RepID=UPI0007802EFD|nr:aspartyl protease family protein [Cellvibrio sp. OA-2007]